MKKPSLRALALTLIPFIGMIFTVPLWDRIYPRILGMPFNLFWLVSWILLTSLFNWVAYRIDAQRDSEQSDQN